VSLPNDQRSVRFRFGPFVVSPRQRTLSRDGLEVPLIPRYFDLLLLLLKRRQEAVHRSEIFTEVWTDVIVSDGALTQAVRALRRALDDDPRDPRYIRTVSRHGYRFVFADVAEEPDTGPIPASPRVSIEAGGQSPTPHEEAGAEDPDRRFQSAMAALVDRTLDEDPRREAAEYLLVAHAPRALAWLGSAPGHASARALLRDARWDVPGAADVPILGCPAPMATLTALAVLRVRRTWRVAGARWQRAVSGAGLAGAIGGMLGGLLLLAVPDTPAPAAAIAVLALIGTAAGAVGAAGIAAGLVTAEVLVRSARQTALVISASAGGLLAAASAQWLVGWTLSALFGLADVTPGGPVQGLGLGAATGLGYGWATSPLPGGGLAAPVNHRKHATATLRVAATCALAAVLLALAGFPMVGGVVHAIAQASRGSQMGLSPLARLIGEPDFGPLTAALVGAGEGGLFGLGLAAGLLWRPRSSRSRRSHESITSR
jgi:DNA-binding winged helix-turn-helix (wHTH) protein